jgi:hypothetical protein
LSSSSSSGSCCWGLGLAGLRLLLCLLLLQLLQLPELCLLQQHMLLLLRRVQQLVELQCSHLRLLQLLLLHCYGLRHAGSGRCSCRGSSIHPTS